MPDILNESSASLGDLPREVERLRLLHAISLEFSASLDFDELLPRVFHRVLAALGAEAGSIWIAEGDMLRCRLAVGGRGERLIGRGSCRSAPGSWGTWPSSRRRRS